MIVVQASLPVVWAMVADKRQRAGDEEGSDDAHDLSSSEFEGGGVAGPFEGVHAGGHHDPAEEVRLRHSVGRSGCGNAWHQGVGDAVVGSMPFKEGHELRRRELR